MVVDYSSIRGGTDLLIIHFILTTPQIQNFSLFQKFKYPPTPLQFLYIKAFEKSQKNSPKIIELQRLQSNWVILRLNEKKGRN